MIALLCINMVVSAAMIALVHWFASKGPPEFYGAAIPTMVHAGVALSFAAVGLGLRRGRFTALFASSVTLGLLALTAWHGLSQVHGADVGYGFGWFLIIIVLGCGGSLVVALVTLLIGRDLERRRQKRQGEKTE